MGKISRYIKNTVNGTLVAGGICFGSMIGCQIYDGYPFHRMIKNQNELEQVVKEEAKKLKIDPAEIGVKYDGGSLGSLGKERDKWIIYVQGDWQTTRNTIRHELYHYKKDVPKIENGEIWNKHLYYLFVSEPRATLYGTLGIEF